jgi:hypothetical protein
MTSPPRWSFPEVTAGVNNSSRASTTTYTKGKHSAGEDRNDVAY